MYVKISSIVSSRFHQKALILLWNSQFMICWSSFFFQVLNISRNLFQLWRKTVYSRRRLSSSQNPVNSTEYVKHQQLTVLLYNDALTTVIMTVWLSTDSSGVDCEWTLPQTDWPKPHTPTDQKSKWAKLQSPQPPIQQLTDCWLSVTVFLSSGAVNFLWRTPPCKQKIRRSWFRYYKATFVCFMHSKLSWPLLNHCSLSEIKVCFFLFLFSIYSLWSPWTSVVLIPEERKLEASVLFGFTSALHRRASDFIG